MLDRYARNSGRYEEVVLADAAHSPHLDRPAEFVSAPVGHLDGA